MTETSDSDIEKLLDSSTVENPDTLSEVVRRLVQDRSHIARWVVLTYMFVILTTMVLIGALSLLGRPIDAFDSILELLKIGVLPIVTLVIGFYFGSSSTDS